MKKRILITGANGFLGSRLSGYFKKMDGYETLGVSHRELEVSDSLAVSAFVKAIRPDYVLHCAGVSNTAACEEEPERSEQINVRGTSNMAKACRQSGSRMVFMSSDQIYNASDSMEPNREEGPHRPCSVYGRDKKRAEEAMLACLHDAVALRLTWMYDYPSSERPGGCGLLGSLLEAGREKRILKLPVHDYRGITYVWEIIRNMEAAMRLPGGVYNFGSQNSRSTFDTAALFLKEMTGNSDVSGWIERDTERFASCPRNLMIDTERQAGNLHRGYLGGDPDLPVRLQGDTRTGRIKGKRKDESNEQREILTPGIKDMRHHPGMPGHHVHGGCCQPVKRRGASGGGIHG